MTLPLSDHFNGKTFFQPGGTAESRFRDFLRWRLANRFAPWPRHVALAPQPPPPAPRGDAIIATWIGHATFLLQTTRGNFLTDPVFSERASPVGWAGPRRAHAPGIEFASLPHIDVALLSHDHYDHCDVPTLRRLVAAHNPLFIAPLRHRDLLEAAGARRSVELDWWQSHAPAPGLTATLTPTKHWSNRFGTPRNHRLWGGFFLNCGPKRVWFASDSGYDQELFRSLRQRLGAPDLALIPIGAYEPRWFMAPMHMNPAEAVQTHLDAGARRSVAMHWGTFQLTDEGRDEPPQALATARAAAGVEAEAFRVLAPGETVTV